MTQQESALVSVEGRDVSKVAALDIGSNSFHLVVARINAGSVQILHRVKQKVRLASGLDADNMLSDDAIERGLSMLKVIGASLEGFEPDSVRVVATHTLRRAKNARRFIREAMEVFPYPIEIISGEEEARLIYSGVAHTSHTEGRRLIIDIGGGSTEFVIGKAFDPAICCSLQMGCVSYTERFFADGKLTTAAFNRATTAAQQALATMQPRLTSLGWQDCIGTSGTIKTLFNLAQRDRSNGHAVPITLKSLKSLVKEFVAAGHIDNLTMPEISEDRRTVVAGGLAILTGVFKILKIKGLHYSPAALREGVLYQMEDELHNADIRGRTAASLATRYDIDTEQANMVLGTSRYLFHQCAKVWKLKHRDFRSMLSWAATLHEVGLQINSHGVQRHSAYILANVDMPGFTQEQQQLLATLVRFYRKKIKTAEIPEFNQYDAKSVRRLIGLLRLAVLLNIKRQQMFLPEFTAEVTKSSLTMIFPEDWLAQRPILSADLMQEQDYWKAIDVELTVK
ncbi:exopolyphosphatase [Salinimonas chungwhensis]|uniref:exopolyphosphatase n=1 Tax=Salinimonas chungwhensis TaxID=265425 RepID=UPI000363AD4D|nr:exopolyphosphatase [Salinimonas chungwhensis]